MNQPYHYWKTKRHIIHFAILMVAIASFITLFFIDLFDTMGHDAQSSPYHSPFTNLVVGAFLVLCVSFILFLYDLLIFAHRKALEEKKMNEENPVINTVEMNVTLGNTNKEEVETPIFETELKPEDKHLYVRSFLIAYFSLFWSLFFMWAFFTAIYVVILLLFNTDDPSKMILPLAIGEGVALFLFWFIFHAAITTNKRSAKESKISNFIVRIYKDRYEYSFHKESTNGFNGDTKYVVHYRIAKYMKTKHRALFKGIVNNAVAILLFSRDDPEDVKVLNHIINGIKLAKGK